MKKLWLLLFVLVLVVCCKKEDAGQSDPLVGTWTMTAVSADGVAKPEWTGSHLVIQQNGEGSGTYAMTDTRYDSIWSAGGIWRKSGSSVLIFDDSVSTGYSATAGNLTVIKILPWTGHQVCTDDICLPEVTGVWNFEFEQE